MLDGVIDAMPEELTLTWPDEELHENWQAIQLDPDHPRNGEVIAVLESFAGRLDELGDRHVMEASRIRWRGFFQDNYRKVIELERGR